MIYVGAVMLLVAVDLIIKYGIDHMPDSKFPRPFRKKDSKIMIRKLHNPGLPFGFLKKYPSLVKMVPLIISCVVLGAWSQLLPKKGSVATKCSYTLILAGAISNLYDRIARKYVVDYFSILVGPLKKVVFNLGDMYIAMGSAIMLMIGICTSIAQTFNNITTSLNNIRRR